MKKPRKAPVAAKGGKAPAGKKRGRGKWKITGKPVVPHHPVSHTVTHHPAAHHHPAKQPHKAPHPHQAKKPAKAAKKRQWSPGSDVACCAAEAYGTLVKASGRPWSHEDTLALYWSTASDPDAGASILDTLEAVGLGPRLSASARARRVPLRDADACVRPLILGVTLPEPHAIAVTPDGTWWSWGEPFNPGDWPELVIEETWAVCAGC